MKFWKAEVVFIIYKDKQPNIYTLHTQDSWNKNIVIAYWRNLFSYMGKNGIYKMNVEEISKEEYLDYWRKFGYEKPYGIE